MKKAYYLSSCNTCMRILKEVDAQAHKIVLQDVKTDKITGAQIDEMKALSGTYEALFSRRAMKYRGLGLNEMELGENDYRKYILQEYTFLKRPVFIIDEQIFVGNSKKVIKELMEAL